MAGSLIRMHDCWFWALLLVVLLGACRTQRAGTNLQSQARHHQHGSANEYMSQTAFEALVKRFDDPKRDQWQQPDRVIESLGPLQGLTVADVGAGTGYFSLRLAPLAGRVVALDIDPRFTDLIARRADSLGLTNLETRITPADRLALQDAEADLIFLVNVYHHIENRGHYFRTARAGLKPGGRLVIVDFKKGELPHGPPDRFKLSPEQVAEELAAAGWQPLAVDTSRLPYQYIVAAQ